MENFKNNKKFVKMPAEELTELIDSFIEIELVESFQILRETLGRIGILKRNVLYQTAHILHKKEKYYIVHFKQLFALDGRENNLNEEDERRLHKIILLLMDWQIIRLKNPEEMERLMLSSTTFVNIAKVKDIREENIILKRKYNL